MSRYSFNVKRTEPRLYAIVKLPNGKLVRQPVKRQSETSKKYDAYIKTLSGLYVPQSLRKHL